MRLAIAGAAFLAATLPAQDWYVVGVPDSQYWTLYPSYFPHFATGMFAASRWNPSPSYVAHVGDVTQNATVAEFERGRWAMGLLGAIPWGASIGNHDYRAPRSLIPCGGPCVANWSRFFGPTTFLNVFPTPEGDVGALHVEWNARDGELDDPARRALEANPDLPTFIVTHAFLGRNPGLPIGGNYVGGQISNIEGNLDGIIVAYPQVFAVLSGHGFNIVRDTRTTPLGGSVFLHCFNVQGDPYGGNGWQRLLRFRGRRLTLYTFSLTWAAYGALGPNRNEIVELTLPRSVAEIRAELRARPVWRGDPVADTWVRSFWGGSYSGATDDSLQCHHAGEYLLIRFDITGAPPAGTALLTLTREGYYATRGPGFRLHRMRRPWAEGDTWNTLGGLTAGVDYELAHDAELVGGAWTHSLDVSASVAEWQTRGGNWGWIGIATGTSGLSNAGFRSREWPAAVERPRLSIRAP
jgi:hypothetical protein